MHIDPAIARLLDRLNHPALPGIDLSLERMWKLLDALGNPEARLPPVIHLAGTNGKGSTLAFLRSIYTGGGYRVHAYTSPHLVRFNERIVLGGEEITDAQLLPLLELVADFARRIPVTFFEATTAVALLAFARYAGDVVLLETGLGGRLDATNVIARPAATVITPIGFDHMEFLGQTLTAIATEKAGIVKPHVLCVAGAQPPEALAAIARVAQEREAPLLAHGRDWNYEITPEGIAVTCGGETWKLAFPSLPGAHQMHNAALASVVARRGAVLPVHANAVSRGIASAVWPGRLQVLRYGPLVEAWGARGDVVLDGAHNIHAAQAIAQWIEAPVTMLGGMMGRKDAVAFFRPFGGKIRRLVTVAITGEASHTPEDLAAAAREAGIAMVTPAHTIDEAIRALEHEPRGTLLIAGSLFLAGELLKNHG